MIYIVEGPRNVGKSYLINKYLESYSSLKFFKLDILNPFKIIKNPYIFIGKDFPILQLIKGDLIDDLIMDRSFLSTLVYGKIFDRYEDEFEKYFINYINELNLKDKVRIILISGKNSNSRRKDYMDFLDSEYELQLKYYNLFIEKINIPYLFLENKFDEESVNLFKGIINE